MDSYFWFDTINFGKSIVHGYNFQKISFFLSKDLFYFCKQCRPGRVMRYFVWVFTVYKSTRLGVFPLGVNTHLGVSFRGCLSESSITPTELNLWYFVSSPSAKLHYIQ